MKVKATHNLSQEEVKQRVIGMAADQAMVIDWVSDYNAVGTLNYSGTKVTGAIDIKPNEVVLSFELPRLARIVAGRIEKQVQKQLESALA